MAEEEDDEALSVGESWLLELARVSVREPPAASLAVGDVVAHYRVLGRLGEGGMGVVYRALDEHLRREVALKLLPPVYARDEGRRARFLREARALAAVTHPNVAAIYEVGEDGERVYFAMELVVGQTVRDRLHADGAVPPPEAVRIARAVASALARAHEKGIVHRDLKPENVMLAQAGEVKVLDFGLAKPSDDHPSLGSVAPPPMDSLAGGGRTPLARRVGVVTSHGQVVGTPGYMAPEQAAGGAVDARTDVYSVGLLLHELVTGRPPRLEEGSASVVLSAFRACPALVPVVARCIETAPHDRYATADDLLRALDALPSEGGAVAQQPSRPPSAPRAPADRVGDLLGGKYHLDALIGAGGVASVYRATHRAGNRVALKLLHPHLALRPELRARFQQEAFTANRVAHPGVVRVLDDDVDDEGSPFLVMELLEGEDLARWSDRVGPAPVLDVLAIVAAVLDVLEAAHAQGVVHRDIKPENVFRTPDGSIRVLDFGIARAQDRAAVALRTKTGSILGTPAFMPPEQARGLHRDVDGRTDLWAVGATAYTLISRRLVHEEDSLAMLHAACATRPAGSLALVAPHVPAPIVAVIDRALAFDKADRWPTARAMRAALEVAALASYQPAGPDTEEALPGTVRMAEPAPPPTAGDFVMAPAERQPEAAPSPSGPLEPLAPLNAPAADLPPTAPPNLTRRQRDVTERSAVAPAARAEPRAPPVEVALPAREPSLDPVPSDTSNHPTDDQAGVPTTRSRPPLVTVVLVALVVMAVAAGAAVGAGTLGR